MSMKKVLVTGAAGFIGFHYAKALCAAGHDVYGVDNMNDYYDVSLKQARLDELQKLENFTFTKLDLADRIATQDYFAAHKPNIVANLAAQPGVRYSIENPHAYIDSNISGFLNVLEGCRHNAVEHLIFASSSSVYGANTKLPFSTADNVDHPISLYAATKKSNELMAHSYAHLYRMPVTGLRFFTVYGPWGRPDMAVYGFTDKLYAGEDINVYNHGDMQRDFTYVDDIIQSMMRLLDKPPAPDANWSGDAPNSATSNAPYALYNIGNNNPVNLIDYVKALEEALGKKAQKEFLPLQAGDVPSTYADVTALQNAIGYKPATPVKQGVQAFVDWYRSYYGE